MGHIDAAHAQHATWGRCKNSESFWTLEDGELHITMTKLDKGTPWDAALQGHEPMDPVTIQEVGFVERCLKECKYFLEGLACLQKPVYDDSLCRFDFTSPCLSAAYICILHAGCNELRVSAFLELRDIDSVRLQVRSDIMKERFQEEHPGFDFSNATFNGNVPDPSKFMGGVSYK